MRMSRPQLRARRYPGAVLLIVLSFLTALFAAGLPGLVERELTSSLQQTLNGTGPADRAATALGPAKSNAASLSAALSAFTLAIPADIRPLTEQAWDGARLGKRLGIRGEPFAAELNLDYRDAPSSHLRLLTGSLPDTAGTVDGREVFDVALTSAIANFFGAHVGSLISSDTYAFRVTGIVAPTDPSSAFWGVDPALATPAPLVQTNGSTIWSTAALIGPGELPALASVLNPDGTPDAVISVYCVPLDTSGYTAQDAGALLDEMTALESGSAAAELHLQITAGPAVTISTFQSERAAVESVLSPIMTGVATVGAATVLLCARLLISRRRTHFALLRARGQSQAQLAVQVLRDLGPPTILALAAGPRTGRADLVRRRPKARRRVFELVVVLLAVGAVAVLRQRGLGASAPGSDTLGALAPILIAAVTTAVAVRCYPLVLAPAARAARRRNGATAFLGLSAAVRSSLGLVLPTFAIVLALTLAALGGLTFRNVESGRAEDSWLQTGTDASIALSTGTDPTQAARAVAALEQVPGVTHATAVAEQPLSGAALTAAVFAVDPRSYTGVSADSPWPFAGALPTRSAPGPVPAVVSADSGYTLGEVVELTPGAAPPLEVRVAGVQAQSPVRPAYGPSEPFILVPSWAVAAYPGYWLESEILLSGSGIDAGKVAAALTRTVPGTNHVVYRADALNQLTHVPLAGLAELGYVVGLVAAGCFGICSTLGLSPRQARGIALAETAPLAASTTLGGLLAAVLLPAVFGSALNLTVFTGLATESALRLDAATPLLTAAGALALTGCGVVLQAAIARRRDVPAQLRMGEDA